MAKVKKSFNTWDVVHNDKVIERTQDIERARHVCLGINLAIEQGLKKEPNTYIVKCFIVIYVDGTMLATKVKPVSPMYKHKVIAIKELDVEFTEGEGLS